MQNHSARNRAYTVNTCKGRSSTLVVAKTVITLKVKFQSLNHREANTPLRYLDDIEGNRAIFRNTSSSSTRRVTHPRGLNETRVCRCFRLVSEVQLHRKSVITRLGVKSLSKPKNGLH